MKNKKAKSITRAAVIATLYTVLTLVSQSVGLASGVIQIRLSEALTVLPCFTPAAIPGLTLGCLVSNLITGCLPWDIVFGTMATLIGAVGTYLLQRYKWAAPIPPIIANTVIVPFVLIYTYGTTEALPYLMLTIGAGEFISAGLLGTLLMKALKRYKGDLI